MENVIAKLLQDFENGKMSRRQLIQSLALAATAAPANSFKTIRLDHISYQVPDYKRTRDFYVDLMGMTVSGDNGTTQCSLHFGDSVLIARNRRPQPGQATSSRPKSTVDHIAYRIDDWNSDKMKAELERRGLKPRLHTGGGPNYASFHVSDPDGFDLQISGIVRPGDSLYKRA